MPGLPTIMSGRTVDAVDGKDESGPTHARLPTLIPASRPGYQVPPSSVMHVTASRPPLLEQGTVASARPLHRRAAHPAVVRWPSEVVAHYCCRPLTCRPDPSIGKPNTRPTAHEFMRSLMRWGRDPHRRLQSDSGRGGAGRDPSGLARRRRVWGTLSAPLYHPPPPPRPGHGPCSLAVPLSGMPRRVAHHQTSHVT